MYMYIYIYIYILGVAKYTDVTGFGRYLGSGVTVRYDFGTTEKKEIYAQFLFNYIEQTVVQIKKKIHLDVKIQNIITCYIYKICFVFIVFILHK